MSRIKVQAGGAAWGNTLTISDHSGVTVISCYPCENGRYRWLATKRDYVAGKLRMSAGFAKARASEVLAALAKVQP